MRWRRLPIEETTLGQSLTSTVERGALKVLDAHSASMPTDEHATQVAKGFHQGYQVYWCLTDSHLLILPTFDIAQAGVESVPRAAVTAVQVRGSTRLDIRVRVADGYRSIQGDRLGAWESLLTELIAMTGQTAVADSLVFSSDGLAEFSGEQTRFTVEYLGGHPNLTGPRNLVAVFDDEALHLLSADGCFERLCVQWADVAELVVEGVEETKRRITATRMLAVGLLALAIPKSERHDRAYITATSAVWGLVLRADQVSPYEARARLGRYLGRVSAAAATDSRSGGGADRLTDALSRVAELHRQGALTEGEFAEAKRQILKGE